MLASDGLFNRLNGELEKLYDLCSFCGGLPWDIRVAELALVLRPRSLKDLSNSMLQWQMMWRSSEHPIWIAKGTQRAEGEGE